MAVFPIDYVSQAGYFAGWGGDATPSTDEDLVMPALSATCVNVAILFTASGLDWDGVWTFYDSDGTQDNDFVSVFNNAGDGGGHNDLQVYIRTNASKYDNKILNVRYVDGGPAGATQGRMYAQWWENVRQVPSCDTIMSTCSTSAHEPLSTNSAMLSIGVISAYSEHIDDFSVWAGAAELYNSYQREDGNSTANRTRAAMCWQTPPDTASSDYLIVITSTGTVGDEDSYTFEIFPYEVVLSNVDGTLVFAGAVDRKISLTRFIEGTLSFTRGILVTLKQWKQWTTAIIRMWLAPQVDEIELDLDPKGFTDIGES